MTPTQPLGNILRERLRTTWAYALTVFNLIIWLIVIDRLQELFK